MRIAKVFKSGNSTAIRIPKTIALKSHQFKIIEGKNGEIILQPEQKNIAKAYDLLTQMSPDFFKDGREDPLVEI